MGLLTGKVAAFYKFTGTSANITNTAATLAVDNITLSIDDADSIYFDKATIKVLYDGVEVNQDLYEICIGGVVFKSVQPNILDYTITGKCYATEQIGGFYDFNVNLITEVRECTEFGDINQRNVPTINSWEASANYYFYVGDNQEDLQTYQDNQTEVIVVLYFDNNVLTEKTMAGYAIISNLSATSQTGEITKGTLNLTGSGKLVKYID